MPDKDKLKAAELWNEASERLQQIINEAASIDQKVTPLSDEKVNLKISIALAKG